MGFEAVDTPESAGDMKNRLASVQQELAESLRQGVQEFHVLFISQTLLYLTIPYLAFQQSSGPILYLKEKF